MVKSEESEVFLAHEVRDSDTFHLLGHVEFPSSERLTTLQKLVPVGHYEVRVGTATTPERANKDNEKKQSMNVVPLAISRDVLFNAANQKPSHIPQTI